MSRESDDGRLLPDPLDAPVGIVGLSAYGANVAELHGVKILIDPEGIAVDHATAGMAMEVRKTSLRMSCSVPESYVTPSGRTSIGKVRSGLFLRSA